MSELETRLIDTVTEMNENQWNHVVEQSDLGCLFHRYGWVQTVEEALDVSPNHVVVSKGQNPIAVFPNVTAPVLTDPPAIPERLPDVAGRVLFRRLVSTEPGTGGPITMTDEKESLRRMFEALPSAADSSVLYHSVITSDPGYVRYGKHFAREGYESNLVNCRLLLDLRPDWETIKANMHKSRRQGLRRAEDADVEVRTPELDQSVVRETYKAYVSNMERIDGEVLPYEFFDGLYESMPNRLAVFVAERDGMELGRYLCLLDDERSAVHYYFAGIPTEDVLKFYPSEALHAAAIQWAQDRNYDYYDFGGSGSDFTDGVFRFKSRFGAKAVPSLMWQKGYSSVGWPVFKQLRDVYRKYAY